MLLLLALLAVVATGLNKKMSAETKIVLIIAIALVCAWLS
jgi:hypothetical protein